MGILTITAFGIVGFWAFIALMILLAVLRINADKFFGILFLLASIWSFYRVFQYLIN